MVGLRLVSETVPKVTGKVFSRKYTMLGRLVTRWEDIVGPELADKTQPVKIRYYKAKKTGKENKATASLDIAATSAEAAVLHYQKDLILERINQIFGDRWITAIRFVPVAANAPPSAGRHKAPKQLNEQEEKDLSTLLSSVQDPDLLEKLKSLGTAILQDRSS